jgi:NADH-quinone oxidoreductase subunit A
MSDAVTASLGVVAYLALFATIGILFLLVNLIVGRFVRPSDPHDAKLEIYECGEPAVGTSFVQFDLRFYVVALLFIIFDVEVAFFFPWATVFGKAIHLADPGASNVVVAQADGSMVLTDQARARYRELGIRKPQRPEGVPPSLDAVVDDTAQEPARTTAVIREGARQLALVTLVDIAVFFAVLLIGFAYVWKRGDLNWVRAYSRGGTAEEDRVAADKIDLEQALSV